MTEERRRPILRLKNPPAAKPVVAAPSRWKCKPCGTLISLTGEEPEDDVVRCPSCNAKLGSIGDFRAAEGDPTRVRARKAA